MFTFPCAVAQQCHQCLLRLVSERVYSVQPVPQHMRMGADLLNLCRRWEKASPEAGAQHRSEETADVCSLKFSFSANTSHGLYKSGPADEWLTATFIHTCSGKAHSLQHSHSGPKKKKKQKEAFLEKGKLAWSLWGEEPRGSWQLARGHCTCTGVPGAPLLTMHRRNSWYLPTWWNSEQAVCPEAPSTFLQLGSRFAHEWYTWIYRQS